MDKFKYDIYPKATKEYVDNQINEIDHIKQHIINCRNKGLDDNRIKGELMVEGYEETLINSLIDTEEVIEEPQPVVKKGFISKWFNKKNVKLKFAKDVSKPIQEQQPKVKEDPHPVFVPNEFQPKVGINSKINELTQRLDNLTGSFDSKTNKEFKIPHNIKSQLKDLAKKNKVMVILLKRNRSCEPFITEIKLGFVMINGVPHNASMDFIFLWKGKYPTMIVPEWDINPVGTKDYYDAVTDNRVADPIATVIRMIESKEILMKNPMNMKMLIWIGLGVCIVGYALFGRG